MEHPIYRVTAFEIVGPHTLRENVIIKDPTRANRRATHGVEIVPLKELAMEMSSGVSYFEQIVWDLERRGVADIDIPVLILGVTL